MLTEAWLMDIPEDTGAVMDRAGGTKIMDGIHVISTFGLTALSTGLVPVDIGNRMI